MTLPKLKLIEPNDFWRSRFFDFLDIKLNKIEDEYSMNNLEDISNAIFEEKSDILGQLIFGFIRNKFGHLLVQEYSDCPYCGKQVKSYIKNDKNIQTLAGSFVLQRPYFYCKKCSYGYCPLDNALGLASSSKQYDVQSAEAWLSSDEPYKRGSETFERITGDKISPHHMGKTVNAIGDTVDILDVCLSAEEINKQIDKLSEDKVRRPVMMLAIDGAFAPTRPEPTPHKRNEKRGKTDWKEVKGFRLYLINSTSIIHLISWHQLCTDAELSENLVTIKNAGLIPEKKVRLGIIGDGAKWIWNHGTDVFPTAKLILDYYHCSEYVYAAGNDQYGKGTQEAQTWCESILTRIYFDGYNDILAELLEIQRNNDKTKTENEKPKTIEPKTRPEKEKPKTAEPKTKTENKKPMAAELKTKTEVEKLHNYLFNHGEKMNYNSAKLGGYHIGSGAIESANKFISNARLKKSGASWYIKRANNMLKIRCAEYNGVFDKMFKKYKKTEQEIMYNKYDTIQ